MREGAREREELGAVASERGSEATGSLSRALRLLRCVRLLLLLLYTSGFNEKMRAVPSSDAVTIPWPSLLDRGEFA